MEVNDDAPEAGILAFAVALLQLISERISKVAQMSPSTHSSMMERAMSQPEE
jgi:hypothetical protein